MRGPARMACDVTVVIYVVGPRTAFAQIRNGGSGAFGGAAGRTRGPETLVERTETV